MLQFNKNSAVIFKELSQICQDYIKKDTLCLSSQESICRKSGYQDYNYIMDFPISRCHETDSACL